MNLQKFSPWNWFKSEGADAPAPAATTPAEPRRGELSPLIGMHQELDRWMDGVMRQFGMPSLEGRFGDMPGMLRPQLDIAERDDEYVISVEVPGVEEKDISLTLDDHRLVIEGEKRQESASGDDRYQRVERAYGSFRRVLDLPADAKAEEIKASFANGVLKVSVPRSGEAKATRRQIPIQ
ncbi:Hsp20/alpha crystallin family protein [Halomonas campisalis]|uniref:Hsp20/alpha crystallin family protein n=1 Tax=Billgrantia campisalis TaxID=74661 RepID=A0ABS9PA86_9GAMM|nr:Hsp20/alpha crystallin family protein [Halomonas campisalis]MCG6658699.1 Hsp20/alpha crystallin family protein [Halomonas campisalis]MDR5864036.1 Hsp20/alpha crystallin family protein [Halomonas campisalis]